VIGVLAAAGWVMVAYAATLGAAAGAVLMVAGGPWLMRILQRNMMARTASDQR
jgi:hypothetical protein